MSNGAQKMMVCRTRLGPGPKGEGMEVGVRERRGGTLEQLRP
jgi:hypothetical protein